MNLHMKSAKHVKMNRTSFVPQYFFKGLQQIVEIEMMSRLIFWRKIYLYHAQLSIAIFFIFNFEMQINLKHHVKSEFD